MMIRFHKKVSPAFRNLIMCVGLLYAGTATADTIDICREHQGRAAMTHVASQEIRTDIPVFSIRAVSDCAEGSSRCTYQLLQDTHGGETEVAIFSASEICHTMQRNFKPSATRDLVQIIEGDTLEQCSVSDLNGGCEEFSKIESTMLSSMQQVELSYLVEGFDADSGTPIIIEFGASVFHRDDVRITESEALELLGNSSGIGWSKGLVRYWIVVGR